MINTFTSHTVFTGINLVSEIGQIDHLTVAADTANYFWLLPEQIFL